MNLYIFWAFLTSWIRNTGFAWPIFPKEKCPHANPNLPLLGESDVSRAVWPAARCQQSDVRQLRAPLHQLSVIQGLLRPLSICWGLKLLRLSNQSIKVLTSLSGRPESLWRGLTSLPLCCPPPPLFWISCVISANIFLLRMDSSFSSFKCDKGGPVYRYTTQTDGIF